MRTWLLVTLGWLALLATVAAVSRVVPDAVAATLFGLFVVASGLGAKAFGARRRRAARADAPDSVERERAQLAAATSFQAALILVVALGAWLAFRDDYTAAAVAYGVVVVLVAVFWISYALLRRRF